MAKVLPWKIAWVTGASTGIGREIALQLAAHGVTVAASARSAGKLAELGEGIHSYPIDVGNRDAVTATAAQIEAELGAIDLALFAAGTYTPVAADTLNPAVFASTMNVNYMGVVNGLAAVLPGMQRRRAGQIAWIASVAGYRGLPRAAAYGPSKAALINLAESLKPELDAAGITLSVVNPGFVDTPLTVQNDFKMPFLMQPADAAWRTIAGLARRKFEIAFPWPFVTMLKIGRILPYGLYFSLIKRQVIRD